MKTGISANYSGIRYRLSVHFLSFPMCFLQIGAASPRHVVDDSATWRSTAAEVCKSKTLVQLLLEFCMCCAGILILLGFPVTCVASKHKHVTFQVLSWFPLIWSFISAIETWKAQYKVLDWWLLFKLLNYSVTCLWTPLFWNFTWIRWISRELNLCNHELTILL